MLINIESRCLRFVLLLIAASVTGGHINGEDSAPSSHMVFDDNFDGDIIVNEVRVPKDGAAMYTYYEALGWRGKGAGYAGIQVHPKAHLFIFSIWDHKEHSAPIKAVHHGPGTETVGFGGEGTGLKSWNFELGWDTDTWYTLVARTWHVKDHTYYGFWCRSDKTKEWTHMVTMDVAVADARFRGGTDAFIEDWLNTGAKSRTSHLRGGWKRKMDKSWYPFAKTRYSVNAWDLVPGKRSYNFRENWNGGTAKETEGDYYFMVSGGASTKASAANPSSHSIKRTKSAPDYEVLKIESVEATTNANSLTVKWKVDPTTTPPFAHRVDLFDNPTCDGVPLVLDHDRRPNERGTKFDLKSVKSARYVRVKLIDIFDRASNEIIVSITKASDE